MNIQEMVEREDFYSILLTTLNEYFTIVRHAKFNCSYIPFDGGEELRIYYPGNIVCRPIKPQGAKTFLNAEYNIRSSFIKFLAGKCFVLYLCFTKRACSPKAIFVTKNILGKNELISPQNRSIRIYDYDKNTVDCIIKKGFTDKYFNNQIAFRKQYKYDFMVPLIDSGEGWFREPILKGHPLARVTGKGKYQKGIDAAIQYVRILANDTLDYASSQEYVHELLTKARQLTEQAKQNKNIATYDRCLALLDFIEKGLNNVSLEVPTCMSHGDFQTGNIWMNNDGKVLLYDWETACRRSVWYDSATLLYSLRREYGWEQFFNDPNPVQSLVCDQNKNRTTAEFDSIKRIVLLEDYLFMIEDMLELPLDWGKEIFDENINRLYDFIIN